MSVDRQAAERAIADFLRALGRDPSSDPELASAPARVVEAWSNELLAGYDVDVPKLLSEGSPGPSGLVVVRGIFVATMCPHHLLPSEGQATVVYRPGARVLGLGTIAALVHAYGRRLSLQEEIGENIVRALIDHAGARGAYCALSLRHACLSTRGAREPSARAETHALAGDLAGPNGAAELSLVLLEPDEPRP